MWWAVLGACANSGLGKPQPEPTGDTAPPVVADCPWVGTWTLTTYQCGAFDYQPFWDAYTGAAMVISQDPTSGCDVAATISATGCDQSESWLFGVPLGTEVDVTRNGITACDPAACTIGTSICNEGGNTWPLDTLTIDDSIDGQLTAVGLIAETGPGCPLDIVTTWTAATR